MAENLTLRLLGVEAGPTEHITTGKVYHVVWISPNSAAPYVIDNFREIFTVGSLNNVAGEPIDARITNADAWEVVKTNERREPKCLK